MKLVRGYHSDHYDRNLTTTSGEMLPSYALLERTAFWNSYHWEISPLWEQCRRTPSLRCTWLAHLYVERKTSQIHCGVARYILPLLANWIKEKFMYTLNNGENDLCKAVNIRVCLRRWHIYLRRNLGGEYENVVILVPIAVNEDLVYREIFGCRRRLKWGQSNLEKLLSMAARPWLEWSKTHC